MELKKLFSDCLDAKYIIHDKDLLEKYYTDESGIKFSYPIIALLPENTQEVSNILKIAYENDLIIIPRGLGTGLSGGAIPLKPSIILSSERMNKIIEIDENNLMVRTQPGVITGNLQKAVEEKGLFYPPDPASLDSCSIGGNIAESSGGPRAVKYGTTRDYVRGVEIVLPNGDIMHFGGKIKKDATGYNIKDLIIGSEGTLGFITEITLSLVALPSHFIDLLIPFDSIENATKTVSDIIKSKITPSTIEFMEERALEIAYKLLGKKMAHNQGKVQLLIRIDGFSQKIIEEQSEIIGEICFNNNAIDVLVADSKPFQDILWSARRNLHDAVVSMSIEMEREDIVVPPSNLPELIKYVKKLEKEMNIPIIIFGHAGDGNVHINLLKTENNKNDYDKNIKYAIDKLMHIAIELNGRLSGEHGIGVFKKEYMHLAFTKEELDLMKRIKYAFDPKNLFNPGKILP